MGLMLRRGISARINHIVTANSCSAPMLPLPEVAVAALFAHQCLISTHRALLPCVSHFLPSSHSGRIISSSPCVIRGSLDEYAASALVACLPDFAIKYIPNDDVFSYANERPSRRLGATFILLLCAIVSLCYAFTRFLSCELELTSQYQWDIIRPGEHCLRYATREYTSRLVQVSGLQDPPEAMRACHETPVQIHRRLLKPDWCQDLVRSRDPTFLLSYLNLPSFVRVSVEGSMVSGS